MLFSFEGEFVAPKILQNEFLPRIVTNTLKLVSYILAKALILYQFSQLSILAALDAYS